MMVRMMRHLATASILVCLVGAFLLMPAQAQPPGWSGDENLAFLLEVNDISAADSDSGNPIPVNLSDPIDLEITIDVGANLTLKSGSFSMLYLGIPIFTQPFDLNIPALEGMSATILNSSLDLGSLIPGGIDLISGTIEGVFAFTYTLFGSTENVTVSENFVLAIGASGVAALGSITGMITVGFAVMAVFSLLLSLDEFQKGILAAHKMRKGKTAKEIGVFPAPVVLRRHPKKGEKISKDELINRVAQAIPGADSVSKYAPKAMDVVRPKSKVPVGKLSKALHIKRDQGGTLAAAMTEMGVFQTRSVKTPLKKVAFSGMSLAFTYWSIMQLFYSVTPDMLTVVFSVIAGLVISVVVGYFMAWLARVPKLGYD
ncbi:MAG: hypothetical protein ACFFDR_04590 [Candidatus Thorarchaeota archaeon]